MGGEGPQDALGLRVSWGGRRRGEEEPEGAERRESMIPPRADEIFGLDFAGAHLAVLGALLDVQDQFLFLVFELHPFAVEFALGLFEGALVFSEPLLGGHAFPEGPFYDLRGGVVSCG